MSAGGSRPNLRVFVNCPFDDDYLPLMQAIVFTITAGGYEPQLALQDVNGGVRLNRIVDLMSRSRLAIHDISRVPLAPSEAPRFNMPFECGVFFGLAHSGAAAHRNKEFLLLDAHKYEYQKRLSDLAGLDPQAHGNDAETVSRCVRSFLASDRRRLKPVQISPPGSAQIWATYLEFRAALPRAAAQNALTVEELGTLDYLPDQIRLMVEWLQERANP
jgi:hypothetical protein